MKTYITGLGRGNSGYDLLEETHLYKVANKGKTGESYLPWMLFFSVSLIVLIVAIGLLFLKGGILGSILATLILIKIWEV